VVCEEGREVGGVAEAKLGGVGECSTGVAQSVGVMGDVVGVREVAFEQVAKAGVEVVGGLVNLGRIVTQS
jgi:hypothetical protein